MWEAKSAWRGLGWLPHFNCERQTLSCSPLSVVTCRRVHELHVRAEHAMSVIPLSRKDLQRLTCYRPFATLGILTIHQRIFHIGNYGKRLSRASRPAPGSGGEPAEQPELDGGGRSRGAVGGAGAGSGDGGAVAEGLAVEVDAAGDAASDSVFDPALAALLAAAGEQVDARPMKRRRRAARGAAAAAGDVPDEVAYASVNTQARAFFERFGDSQRLQPLVAPRKRARPGRFNTDRLRTLEDFILSLNVAREGQTRAFHFLRFWEETMPGAPGDDGSSVPLQQSFKSAHAFRQAIADDIDKAVVDDGWLSCILTELGVEYEAFVRDALSVCLKQLRSGKKVRFWSGGDGVAPQADRREGPLDGDAFYLCEAEVVAGHGTSAFVLAIHVYSDSSVLSGSGGKPRDTVFKLLRVLKSLLRV